MKVADVYYCGPSLRHSRRGPSDTRYSWQQTTSDVDDIPEEVENVEDAIAFEGRDNLEVDWTPLGQLAKSTKGPATKASKALESIGYRQKQKIAKSLGLKANSSEEELDEKLKPEVERLQDAMEV
ncbi:MAG: hypothetical protein ABEK59_11790 [Halobacteria archaeon]